MTTITLTPEQLAELTFLAETGMNNEPTTKEKKTIEQITYQVIERGISSIKMTRTQYARTRAAVKAFKG